MKNVSLIIPSRNTKKYFDWMYNSVRKNLGKEIKICAADDNSDDGTSDYFYFLSKSDKNFSFIINDSEKRLGHTILYDKICKELVKTPIAVIAHSDMYWFPNTINNMLKHMKEKTIVSATRIEPPLHPPEPDVKIVLEDLGIEPDFFDEEKMIKLVNGLEKYNKNKFTKGVFAPWMFNIEDFWDVGGHDWENFAPQSREDDDIWLRLLLNGCSFIQSWDAFIVHLTCRGSRFNPQLTKVGTNSKEWEEQNKKSEKNFVKKWGHMPAHDNYHHPLLLGNYDHIKIKVKNEKI